MAEYLKECRQSGEPSWLANLRSAAADSFLEQGFPGRELESWKYSPLKALPSATYRRPQHGAAPSDLSTWLVPGIAAHLLVFVDGRYSPELSEPGDLPEGVTLTNLRAAVAADLAPVAEHFGGLAALAEQPLVALNGACWEDGLYLHVADGASVRRPVHLLQISASAQAGAAHPRNLVVVERGASVCLIEQSVAKPGAAGLLCNAVTELYCGSGAGVEHIKIQRDAPESLHVGHAATRLDAESRYKSREISWDGLLTRRESRLVLAGTGAKLDHGLLYLGEGKQTMDMRSRVEHTVAGCESNILSKGILAGESRGIFDGNIFVAEGAGQTLAMQTNRNLLLSGDSVASSIPRLEIYADDVKCSHGSTTGRLANDAIFYLRTRGIPPEEARAMLLAAFARELVEAIEPAALRGFLETELMKRLPGGERNEGRE